MKKSLIINRNLSPCKSLAQFKHKVLFNMSIKASQHVTLY